ncbi:YhbY family RNA-binding protein [Piscirickettsia litoralis]|uniref:CRS1 / YhbY domain protein n=1 Tax=Piscirickettsia litoralis TaxID=1891921 RepID=A0ABX3A688_9GAMM|nr:YhbY family RNA-binding protein [Piscirickettsia litoralis]ODN43206.1 CRS1 / YhbY domain protein [Piscirickettsia litoralis]
MALSSQEKQTLKSRAHHLKPVVTVSHKGLTENVANELEIALAHHELIKVRINCGDRDKLQQITDTICENHQADCVQIIGFLAVLYRQAPAKPAAEKPKTKSKPNSKAKARAKRQEIKAKAEKEEQARKKAKYFKKVTQPRNKD